MSAWTSDRAARRGRRYFFRMRLATSLIVAAALAATITQTASADVRYASPSGSGTSCTELAPCALTTAVNTSPTANREVIVAPGEYGSSATPIGASLNNNGVSGLRIHGVPGQPKPLIHTNASFGVAAFGPNSLIADLDVRSYGGAFAVVVNNVGSIDRVRAISSTAYACGFSPENTVKNSICISSGGAGASMGIGTGGIVNYPTATVRNSVFWSLAPSRYGLEVSQNGGARASVDVFNSVLEGGGGDVQTVADSPSTYTVALYNSVASDFAADPEGPITAANPVSGTAAFANIAAGEVTTPLGSPLIDAGADDPANGATDFFGNARVQGPRVDVGAFEATPLPAAPAPPQPILTKFKFTKKKFRAATKGASIQPAKNAKKKANKGIGSTFSFTSAEIGTVRFTLYKWSKKKGLTKFRRLSGVDSQKLARGNVKFWFNGRWHKKKLAPGKYQLRASPVAAGTKTLPEIDLWPTVLGPTITIVK